MRRYLPLSIGCWEVDVALTLAFNFHLYQYDKQVFYISHAFILIMGAHPVKLLPWPSYRRVHKKKTIDYIFVVTIVKYFSAS